MIKPKITLVGAGPGDPELLTVKAVKALQSAKVVVYDALVSTDILDYAPQAEWIFAGKRGGGKRTEQDAINRLLVAKALSRGHVVRLKGGDPFVFGRGYEEVRYARSFGIETNTVIGVSSVNLPGLLNVPLTLRGMNESFRVLTGTTASGKLSEDIADAAQSSASVLIFMGLRKLPEIAALYEAYGRGDTPALVVQDGSLPTQHVVFGKITDLPEKAKAEGIRTPALILIGEVAGLYAESYEEEKLRILPFRDEEPSVEDSIAKTLEILNKLAG